MPTTQQATISEVFSESERHLTIEALYALRARKTQAHLDSVKLAVERKCPLLSEADFGLPQINALLARLEADDGEEG